MAIIARWPLYQGVLGGRCIKVVIVGELGGLFFGTECIIYLFLVSFIYRCYLTIFSVDKFPNYSRSY